MKRKQLFNIVLIQPEIPQNTGNVGRLCVNTGAKLHLVKPLGFSLEDKYLRRAGLDYWQHLDLAVYENDEEFFTEFSVDNCFFFSTRGGRTFWDCPYPRNSCLIFGNESSGFPRDYYLRFINQAYTVPMLGDDARSLNLANAVAVVLYEGVRRYF